MKHYFLKGIALVAMATVALPAIAQKEKSDKDDKEKQTIVITRDVDANEKTVIEIKGDKVTINGKDAKDSKDVHVNVRKFKNGANAFTLNGRGNNWNFDFDNDGVSLFSEDENRAMLGVVTDVDDKGAEISSVSKESAAEKAGLKKGDIITRIGDTKIEDAEDVSKAVRAHKPGDKVSITILRAGKEQTLNAELGKWKGVKMNAIAPGQMFERTPVIPSVPGMEGRTYNYNFNSNRPKLGLSIQDTDDGKGVKVIDVDEEGHAAKAGIKEDDVITHVDENAVNSADEISKYMKESKDKASVRMQVLRDGKKQNIEVRIPRKLKTADL